MRIGQLSAAGMTGVGLSRIFSGILAVQLPLLVRNDEELDYVLDKMKPDFEKKLEAKGFKILIWTKIGWVHFFSKKPVVRPDDLKEQKMFIYAGDPDGVLAWKDAGFHPVPLSPTDIMSSLQSNMVEAFSATPLTAASYQWFALAKNMCGMKWAPLIGGIVINARTWKRIPSDQRPELLEAAKRIALTLQAEADKADEQAIVVMKQHGLIINPVSPDVEAQWKAAVQNAFAKVAGKSFDKASYEKVKQHLKTFRANDAR
jgi:TRAP-type C4-dicarboxylate transport system substrate-binding protein